MTTGTIFLIVGNNKNYCFIRIKETGKLAFAPRDSFSDPELMVTGANVKFNLVPGEPKPKAEQVEAA